MGVRVFQKLLVLAIFLFASLVVLGLSGRIPPSTAILAAVLLVLAFAAHMWIVSYKPARRRRFEDGRAGEVDPDTLDSEVSRYFKDVPIAKAMLYADAISNPANLRGRLSEYIEPLNRTVRQRVSITIEMPDTGGHDLWFPLIIPVKGELQDDLKITLDGETVPTLTYREYLLVTIAVLTSLVAQARVGLESLDTNTEEGGANLKSLREAAKLGASLIALRARLDSSGKKKMEECTGDMDRLADLLPKGGNARLALTAAASLVRTLAGHYAILTVVPRSTGEYTRHVVEYERFQIPSLKLASVRRPHRWVKDRIAALLGARPIYLELDLSNAATVKSYHLMIIGPEGTYAALQAMPDHREAFAVGQGDGGREDLDQPYRRLQRRRGQRYFHVYMRSIPETLADKLRLSVKFYEIPPGSLATATAAAVSAFALIYLAGIIINKNYPTLPGFSEIVLLFPAAAAAFAGFESRSTSLVSGTLASRATSLVSIALALSASVLAMAQSAQRLRAPVADEILGVHDRGWQVLAVIALFNAGLALYAWITRTAFFYLLAERPDDRPNQLTEKGA